MADIRNSLAGALENLSAMLKKSPDSSFGSSKERVSKWWSADKSYRAQFERRWQINISYYAGNQWIAWDSSLNTINTLKAPAYKRMAVDNRIFPKIRSSVTRMIMPPESQVIPDGATPEARNAALFKERVLNHVHRLNKRRLYLFSAALWGKITGDCYLEAYWDPEAGDSFETPDGTVQLGDIRCHYLSPYEVWPGSPSSEGNWGGRVWVGEFAQTDIVKQRFNLQDIASDASSHADLRLRVKFSNFFSDMLVTNSSSSELDDMTFVRRLYDFRAGKLYYIVGEEIVQEAPLDWFGIEHYQNLPNFGGFFGDTELRQAIGRQKTHNRLVSSLEEYTRIMKGKWLYPASANVKREPDSETGEVITYHGAVPPQMVAPPALPPEFWRLMESNLSSIDDIFSDHLASQGRAKQLSGVAIQQLVEEDERQHTPTLDRWEEFLGNFDAKILDLANRKYDEHHKIIVMGDDLRVDVLEVNPQLLQGTNRVIIAEASGLPRNKVLRAEIIRRNFAEGLYGPRENPEVAKKALRQISAGVVDDVYDQDALDEMRAERENQLMRSGQPVPPEPYENLDIHYNSHSAFMKTDEFYELPTSIQDIFDAHLYLTDQMRQAKLAGVILPPTPNSPNLPGQPSPPVGGQPGTGPSGYEPSGTPRGALGPEDMAKSFEQSAAGAPLPGQGVPLPKE